MPETADEYQFLKGAGPKVGTLNGEPIRRFEIESMDKGRRRSIVKPFLQARAPVIPLREAAAESYGVGMRPIGGDVVVIQGFRLLLLMAWRYGCGVSLHYISPLVPLISLRSLRD